ncbi:MAG: hypothetical protein R6U68_13560, partial [Desulfobacteraceae bacterium]
MSSDLPSGGDNQPSYFAGLDARSAMGEHGLDIEVRPDKKVFFPIPMENKKPGKIKLYPSGRNF